MIKLGTNSIGKIYLGTNSIGRAYLGSNLVFQKGSSPTPATMIPYIRGGGDGSYIDTGITPDNTTRVIVWARNFNVSGSEANWLFGARPSSNDGYFDITASRYANTGKLNVDYGTTATVLADAWKYFSGYHKYEFGADGFFVDDTQLVSGSSVTFSISQNIHLFGYNAGGTHTNSALPTDICACKIYKNNVLVRDYTAVNSPSVGLYDAVSDTVFTNAGSGSFTYGEFSKFAYTPLEYISCSGSQYFDSGVKGSYADGLVTKFMPTNTTAQWTSLLGYRSSTSSCDISLGTATSGQDNMRCYWRFGTNDTSGNAFNGSTSNKLTNKDVVAVKSDATLTLYQNNLQIGTNEKSGVSSSFQTAGDMAVGTVKTGSTYNSEGFIGRIYYVGIGGSRSLVPAKVNNVAGLYDTYNDVFYPSISGTDFTAGTIL